MRREKLSIDLFGKATFCTGIVIGVFTAVLINYFLSYGREILRWQTATSDLVIPSSAELIAYNLFFGAVSFTAGFGLMIWFWFHNPFKFKRPDFG